MLRWLAVLAVLTLPLASGNHAPCPPEDCVVLRPFPYAPYVDGDVRLAAFVADVQVQDGIATTSLEFHVQSNATAEAKLAVPMPGRANLMGFTLTAGNRTLQGRVRESAQAQAEYEEAKAAGLDAAFLDQASDGLVRLRINVPAGDVRVLRATYVELVPRAAGELVYHLPVARLPPADSVRLGFDVRSTVGAEGLRFPELPMAADPSAPGRSTYAGGAPGKDLVAVWREGSGWTGSLVASRPVGEKAEWVAQVCAPAARPLARDVVFVLDRSGSMSGTKIEEASASLRSALLGLRPGDHFDVVAFDDHMEPLHGVLAPAPAAAADIEKVAAIGARGGTDIDGGLQAALAELNAAADSSRLRMVVFITDGLPSAGVTDHDAIIERFVAANERGAHIQVVPIGLDADRTFLADLALRSGGTFTPIDPVQGFVEERLGRLYDVVGHPVLSDVRVQFRGFEDVSLVQAVMPPIYEDDCLVLTLAGRLPPGGQAVLEVSGTAMGAAGHEAVSRTFTFSGAAIPVDPAAERVYAGAYVEALLSQERIEGTSDALRRLIIDEAVRLRQVTPYTAWVIADVAQSSAWHDVGDGVAFYLSTPAGAATQGAPPPHTMMPGPPPEAGGTDTRADQEGGRAEQQGPADRTTTPGPGAFLVALAIVGLAVLRRRA
jgi:Ca-activated chloride channel homolog